MPPESTRSGGMVVLMGLGELFRRDSRIYNEATGVSSGGMGLKSPWSNSAHLSPIILPETPNGPVSVAQALAVPPVSRAIQLYSTVISSFPLVAEGARAGDVKWLDATAGAVTARHRSALTLQDLIFTAGSLWWKELADADGYPMIATRVPRHLWSLDPDGYVTNVEGERLDQARCIYIPSLVELGFLEVGRGTINHYHYLGKQILNRSKGAKPLLDLHVNDANFEPTEEEAKQVIDDWTSARLSENGATAFSPYWLDVKELGTGEVSMLQEARNAVRLDVANFLNINAAMLDGNNGTSDTYSNTLQNANEFLQLSLRAFLEPIEQRLSQDDVTPAGVTVRFDTTTFDTFTDAAGNTGRAVAPARNGDQ